MAEIPVSVIIPSYNRADRVLNSVNSVLNQTHKELEVIVVDDGSTDNTCELLENIADSRLRVHKLEKNAGAPNARNVGVSLAKYDVIAFNDSDDLWHEDKLEKQLAYWKAHPEHVMVYCAYKIDLPDGGILQIPSPNEDEDTLCGDIFYYLMLRPAIGTPTMVMTKKLFEEVGGFDVNCGAMQDWDFSVRASYIGSIGYVNEPLLTVEATAPDRISNKKNPKSMMAHYETRCRVLGRYIKEVNEIGQLDLYESEILNDAQKDGVLDQVKELMAKYIP